jgi:hypothetical protein
MLAVLRDSCFLTAASQRLLRFAQILDNRLTLVYLPVLT